MMRAFNHGGTGLSSVRQFKHLIQSLKEEFNGLSGTLMTTDSKPFKPLDGTDGKWRFKKAEERLELAKKTRSSENRQGVSEFKRDRWKHGMNPDSYLTRPVNGRSERDAIAELIG